MKFEEGKAALGVLMFNPFILHTLHFILYLLALNPF